MVDVLEKGDNGLKFRRWGRHVEEMRMSESDQKKRGEREKRRRGGEGGRRRLTKTI